MRRRSGPSARIFEIKTINNIININNNNNNTTAAAAAVNNNNVGAPAAAAEAKEPKHAVRAYTKRHAAAVYE